MNRVKIPSYGKIYAVGHAALGEGFFDQELRVEEKLDGSQFSFGVVDGELATRSNRVEFDPHAPPNLFAMACDTVIKLFQDGLLPEGIAFRGECITSPRHNVLTYDRIPKGGVILFDAFGISSQGLLDRTELEAWAKKLDLEVVPWLATIQNPTFDQLLEIIDNESCLGGPNMEGMVLKPVVTQWGRDGKPLNGKYVSEKFKEKHEKESYGPAKKTDLVLKLAEMYAVEARWHKAVQHLREEDLLENSPRDIGKLIPEVIRDTFEECEEEMKQIMFNHFKKDLTRTLTRGLPEWYKEYIAKEQIG